MENDVKSFGATDIPSMYSFEQTLDRIFQLQGVKSPPKVMYFHVFPYMRSNTACMCRG